jgi:hypothetical protein
MNEMTVFKAGSVRKAIGNSYDELRDDIVSISVEKHPVNNGMKI